MADFPLNRPAVLWGIPIQVVDDRMLAPSHGEDARRIVRHGLARYLLWWGESPGPRPGEQSGYVISPGQQRMMRWQ